MKNVINKIQIQEQKPSVVADAIAAPVFSDYNHENSTAFLFKVSKM